MSNFYRSGNLVVSLPTEVPVTRMANSYRSCNLVESLPPEIPLTTSRSSVSEASPQIVSTISYPRNSNGPTRVTIRSYDYNLIVSHPSSTTFYSITSTALSVSTISNPQVPNRSSATAMPYQRMSQESSLTTRAVNSSIASSTVSTTLYPIISNGQSTTSIRGASHGCGSVNSPPSYEDQRPETPPPSYEEVIYKSLFDYMCKKQW